TRYETELANDYGNLASRTLAMIKRYRGGQVPLADPDPDVAADFDGLVGRVAERLDHAELTAALDEIWQRVRRLNRYVEERAPWKLAKDAPAAGELDRTLYSLAEGLRVIAVLLYAYMPASSERLLTALLGQPQRGITGAKFGMGPGGATVGELEPLFPKL
ncbi:MAG: methionyl-tRNA synthetase, partial [Solirubrobacteraceae bacterium]|nr:methionyl-tRNA synthetase [Solirubrobacteraceae bacterium]